MQKVPDGILSDLVERRRPEIMQLSGEAVQDEEDFIRQQGYIQRVLLGATGSDQGSQETQAGEHWARSKPFSWGQSPGLPECQPMAGASAGRPANSREGQTLQ